jgi:hypothetical protein
MERWRAAHGQASGEYVALVALVAVVLALAAGLTSGGVGGAVLAGLQQGLCRVAGTACPAPRPSRPDLAPCPVETTTTTESLDGAFDFVQLGRDGTLTAVRTSDGRVAVTLAHGTTIGGQIGLGLRVAAGQERGAEATAGLTASVASGRTWTLPDAAAARAFIDRYGSKATIGGQAVDLLRSRCSILCDAVGWRPHAKLPPPDERYMSHGGAVDLAASYGPASAQLSGSALLGSRLRRDGSSTWYLQLDAEGGADVAAGAIVGSVGAAGEAVVSYTLDAHRRPLELNLQTTVRTSAGGALHGEKGERDRASAELGADAGLLVERSATLDLRDPQNRAAAAAFLAALRDPLAPGELRRSATAVHERIAQSGIVDRRTYVLSSSAFALGATVALGAELGGGFERKHEGMRLLSAETRLPGLPFLPRDDCRVA